MKNRSKYRGSRIVFIDSMLACIIIILESVECFVIVCSFFFLPYFVCTSLVGYCSSHVCILQHTCGLYDTSTRVRTYVYTRVRVLVHVSMGVHVVPQSVIIVPGVVSTRSPDKVVVEFSCFSLFCRATRTVVVVVVVVARDTSTSHQIHNTTAWEFAARIPRGLHF